MRRILTLPVTALILLGACRSKSAAPETPAPDSALPAAPTVLREQAIRAFKANGDYADNVIVTLSPDGKRVEYRPEINEVDAYSAPARLYDGYVIDPVGVTADSRFLSFTYGQYAQLPATPTDEEILAAVIPGAVIEEIIEIPLARRFAMRNPNMCDSILIKHRGDCRVLFSR